MVSLQVQAVGTGTVPDTVKVNVTGFPGSPGMEFTIASNGNTSLNFTFMNDVVLESNETFTVTLISPDTSLVMVSGQSMANVTIVDDDSKMRKDTLISTNVVTLICLPHSGNHWFCNGGRFCPRRKCCGNMYNGSNWDNC